MAIPDKVLLRFVKYCAPYNSGELAQLPKDAALRVISAGSAVAVSKDAPGEPDPEVMREVHAIHRAQLLQMGVNPETIARCIALGVGPLEAGRVTIAGLESELNRREAKALRDAAEAKAAQPEPETVSDANPADKQSGDSSGDDGDGDAAEAGHGKRKK